MKKLMILLLSLIMIIAITGCSNDEGDTIIVTSDEEENQNQNQPAEKPVEEYSRTFIDESFGLEITVPDEWEAADPESLDENIEFEASYNDENVTIAIEKHDANNLSIDEFMESFTDEMKTGFLELEIEISFSELASVNINDITFSKTTGKTEDGYWDLLATEKDGEFLIFIIAYEDNYNVEEIVELIK